MYVDCFIQRVSFQYTPEEIEWYGLTWGQALQKIHLQQKVINAPKPLKHEYRSQLIDQLKIHGIAEAQDEPANQMPLVSSYTKYNECYSHKLTHLFQFSEVTRGYQRSIHLERNMKRKT